jgi:HAD superfamily hydrolase (TIGR01457 family)
VSNAKLSDLLSISTYVFDLDGVVYLGNQRIPHAADSINQLIANQKQVYFLTNNSSSTRQNYVEKLRRMTIDVDESRIYTSAFATALYLKEIGAAGRNAFVIGESGLQQEIRSVGLNTFLDPTKVQANEIDYVIAGIDWQFSYAKLAFGHECLVHGHAAFIATNRDSTYPSEKGSVPGAGSLVIALATSSGIEPLTIGKPEPTALREIVKAAGATAQLTLMIGDRLDTDIAGGVRAGTRTACVLTGVTTREAAETASGEQKPEFIIDDLRELLLA